MCVSQAFSLRGEPHFLTPSQPLYIRTFAEEVAYAAFFVRKQALYMRPLEWTGEDQVLLLQTALYGKSQEAYVALSATDRKDYRTVKDAVLHTSLSLRLTDSVFGII